MTLSAVHRKLVENNVIDFSVQYLFKLVKDGCIPYTIVRNKKDYDYKEVKKALKTYAQKPAPEEDAKVVGLDPNTTTLNEAKVALTIHQAALAKKKVDIEDSKYILRADVEKQAFTTTRIIRDQILTIPERLSGEIASITDITVIKEMLYKEINEVLNGLTDKSLYEKD